MYGAAIALLLVLGMIALSLVRLRIRFELGSQVRQVFFGFGRTGLEIDWITRYRTLRIWGIPVRRRPIAEAVEQPVPAHALQSPGPAKPVMPKRSASKIARSRDWLELLDLLPASGRAFWKYATGLLKAVIVEQMDGQIEAGFAQPDYTGIAFGYYQAALATAPSVIGRVAFVPRWEGPTFTGHLRGSIALPLHRLILDSVLLAWRLPCRRIIRFAIGKKKGVPHD